MALDFLLIGSGGREHAIARSLAQCDQTRHVYVAPGNGGTASTEIPADEKVENINIPVSDLMGLRDFAIENRIDQTVVGPEAPLAAGIVDLFHAADLPCFGPTQNAAQLESSKAYAKDFMARWSIPTARGASFRDYDQATAYLETIDWLPVLKASGLAAGKGVLLPETLTEARDALREMMVERRFGDAGDQVVIEERLSGYEISLLAIADGKNMVTLPAARDHKRLLDGDRGPNTGGMGAVAPVLQAEDPVYGQLENIMQQVIEGMAAEGAPYVGVLYGGFMMTSDGPKVLEFNCRFGDPETQAVLPLLSQGALVESMVAASQGDVSGLTANVPEQYAATIVLASGGYPGSYPKGVPITGTSAAAQIDGVEVYHAGTRLDGETLVTSGGRVLSVTGTGFSLDQALERAYKGADMIHFDGKQMRRDIGRTLE